MTDLMLIANEQNWEHEDASLAYRRARAGAMEDQGILCHVISRVGLRNKDRTNVVTGTCVLPLVPGDSLTGAGNTPGPVVKLETNYEHGIVLRHAGTREIVEPKSSRIITAEDLSAADVVIERLEPPRIAAVPTEIYHAVINDQVSINIEGVFSGEGLSYKVRVTSYGLTVTPRLDEPALLVSCGRPGEWTVTVEAWNHAGRASADLRVVAGKR